MNASQVPLRTQHTTNIIDEMPSEGIETTIPAIEGLQTHALDCTATGIGKEPNYNDETVPQYTAVTTNTGHTHVSEIRRTKRQTWYPWFQKPKKISTDKHTKALFVFNAITNYPESWLKTKIAKAIK